MSTQSEAAGLGRSTLTMEQIAIEIEAADKELEQLAALPEQVLKIILDYKSH